MIEEYWWISWANVQYKEGYLGQMCNTKRDIWGKCAIIHVATLLLKKEDVVRLVDIYNMVGERALRLKIK